MKACFHIAECSLFYAKIVIINLICKRIHIKRSFIHNFAAFSSIIMPVFKQGFFALQTRLVLIANKASFHCKQGLFGKVKEQKNAKEQKHIEIQVVTTRSQNLSQSDADSECHVAGNHL